MELRGLENKPYPKIGIIGYMGGFGIIGLGKQALTIAIAKEEAKADANFYLSSPEENRIFEQKHVENDFAYIRKLPCLQPFKYDYLTRRERRKMTKNKKRF